MENQRQPKITAVTSSGFTENEPVRTKKKGGFGSFLKRVFVENWYLAVCRCACHFGLGADHDRKIACERVATKKLLTARVRCFVGMGSCYIPLGQCVGCPAEDFAVRIHREVRERI